MALLRGFIMDNQIIHNHSDMGFSFALLQGHRVAIAECSQLEKGLASASFQDCSLPTKQLDTYRDKLQHSSNAYFFNLIRLYTKHGMSLLHEDGLLIYYKNIGLDRVASPYKKITL